jgi:hypothetical protein
MALYLSLYGSSSAVVLRRTSERIRSGRSMPSPHADDAAQAQPAEMDRTEAKLLDQRGCVFGDGLHADGARSVVGAPALAAVIVGNAAVAVFQDGDLRREQTTVPQQAMTENDRGARTAGIFIIECCAVCADHRHRSTYSKTLRRSHARFSRQFLPSPAMRVSRQRPDCDTVKKQLNNSGALAPSDKACRAARAIRPPFFL